MSSEQPFIYFILGAAGSGRREVLADLLEDGGEAAEKTLVLLEQGEAPSEFDHRFPEVARWQWSHEEISAEIPGGYHRIFFVSSGRGDPVAQVEKFSLWLPASGFQLARIISVVNCQLAEKNPPLLQWYEACVHFSDVVLLNRREGVANKWISEFRRHFEKLYYPCLFEFVKHGRVENPARVLVPEARRLTHVFEAEPDYIFLNSDGEEIDEEAEPESDEEEVEAKVEEDPYFVRDAAGRRAKKIPDIQKFLT